MLVDGTDLDQWAERREAQSLLPELIRRLLRATTTRINLIDIPSGEAIQQGGWDGIVNLKEGNEYFPAEISVCEISTQGQVTRKANQDYDRFVVGMMAGKKLEFNPQIFERLVHLVKPLYTLSSNEKNELFLNAAFDRSDGNPELNQLAEGVSDILEEPFFSIDGGSWTVTEFMEELQRHPLVFRNKIDDKGGFTKQYKLAIVDLVRDHYLTKEAYKRGIQDAGVVKRNTQMWRDNLLALHQKHQYLKERIPNLSDSLNAFTVIEEYLNPYIDELQEKYSDRVEVNVQEFNDIHLTRIDMFATQRNVPFPVMVPAFPSITTDYKLDYGKRIE